MEKYKYEIRYKNKDKEGRNYKENYRDYPEDTERGLVFIKIVLIQVSDNIIHCIGYL